MVSSIAITGCRYVAGFINVPRRRAGPRTVQHDRLDPALRRGKRISNEDPFQKKEYLDLCSCVGRSPSPNRGVKRDVYEMDPCLRRGTSQSATKAFLHVPNCASLAAMSHASARSYTTPKTPPLAPECFFSLGTVKCVKFTSRYFIKSKG